MEYAATLRKPGARAPVLPERGGQADKDVLLCRLGRVLKHSDLEGFVEFFDVQAVQQVADAPFRGHMFYPGAFEDVAAEFDAVSDRRCLDLPDRDVQRKKLGKGV